MRVSSVPGGSFEGRKARQDLWERIADRVAGKELEGSVGRGKLEDCESR